MRRIYLDNPAGTQVPELVIQRMTECLVEANANLGGHFKTASLADQVVSDARLAMARRGLRNLQEQQEQQKKGLFKRMFK